MTTFLLVIHVLVSLFLIFVVLVQGGKGAELGAAFGGSSQTVFGGRGAATFLSKLTTGVAVVFMLTSLLLAMASVKGSSVVKQPPVKDMPQTQGAPTGQPGGQPGIPSGQPTPVAPSPTPPATPAR